MPQKRKRDKTHHTCDHVNLTYDASPVTATNGYTQYTPQQLSTAATGDRKNDPEANRVNAADFPAPLALPGDLLYDDPKYPAQSLRSWLDLAKQRHFRSRGDVIYVAEPPSISDEMGFMENDLNDNSAEAVPRRSAVPNIDLIIEYLRAFYHGIEVKKLPLSLSFVPWETETKIRPVRKAARRLPERIGLCIGEEMIGIRVRHNSVPKRFDIAGRNLFRFQMNQLDLLDAAMALLPADAFSLLLILNQDLYEDDNDDFCCGRAFGGNLVAVVSTARYDPAFDVIQGVNREHAWPASHCAAFVDQAYGITASKESKACPMRVQDTDESEKTIGGLRAAVNALSDLRLDSFDVATNYLFRICRTASHELGHCVWLDHCVYYACAMQGTATLLEDNRQPPYLCPVCEAKLAAATIGNLDQSCTHWKQQRHRSMLAFTEQVGGSFGPFGAWTRSILRNLADGS